MYRLSYVLLQGFFLFAIHDEFILHNGKDFVCCFTKEWSEFLSCILYFYIMSLAVYLFSCIFDWVYKKEFVANYFVEWNL